MNQTKLEISVGAFVIIGLAAVAYLALKIGAGLLVGTDTYLVSGRFTDVSGLGTGGKVTISGVTIGSVDTVRLDPGDYGALVRMRVRADVKLPVDSSVAVKTNGLLGDKYLSITPGPDAEMMPTDGKGMFIDTRPAVDLESLIGHVAFGSVSSSDAKKGDAEAEKAAP
jgi:phospholipid/cholesterol/gamma-HCH transport system substrate-binding protein